jgi:hypothetical protein
MEPQAPEAGLPDGGAGHLIRIERIQWVLLPLGSAAWACHSWRAAQVFLLCGGASVLFWHLHRVLVTRMLTPSVRRRWLYGALVVFKLALIVLILRGMMVFYPLEVIPLVTGILLFSASILVEAFWLALRPVTQDND